LDLDDVLFLERDYVRSGFEAVGVWAQQRLQIPDFAERAYREFESGRRGDIFDAVLSTRAPKAGRTEIRAMRDIYRRHLPSISVLPDAAEFLDVFRPMCRMVMISDGPTDSQRRKLDALGVRHLFDFIVLTGAWGKQYSKPHPRAFQSVQRRFQVPGMTYFYVADNPEKDFQAPLALGWGTARVRRSSGIYSMRESQAGFEPHFEVPDLKALTPMLLKLAQGGEA